MFKFLNASLVIVRDPRTLPGQVRLQPTGLGYQRNGRNPQHEREAGERQPHH